MSLPDLTGMRGYYYFSDDLTEETYHRSQSSEQIPSSIIDSLLTATTDEAARNALENINQYMRPNPMDAFQVIRLARNDGIPSGILLRLVNLLKTQMSAEEQTNLNRWILISSDETKCA